MGRKAGGETGIDDQYVARGFDGIGAWILGRNMFGPIRGPWPDESWHGWWGKNPPYHTPVFVLTRHARKPLRREGDTVFHFVTSGIQDALQQASAAAGGKDERLGRRRRDDPGLPACRWLLVRGVDEQRWREQAHAGDAVIVQM